MRVVLTTFVLVLMSACQTADPMEQLPQLAGYWEIAMVELPDGTTREFGVNTVIDYIEVNGAQGVRKKLTPSLAGRYAASESAETFHATVDNGDLVLQYNTPFDNWEETILKVKDSMFSALNSDGKIYTYRRYVPLDLDLP